MRYSTLQCLCFVEAVGWGNVNLSSVDGWLTSFQTFIYTHWSCPIAICAMHWNHRFENGIHCRGNWETIGNTSKRWYVWLRELSGRDEKHDNIWTVKQLESQKTSSGIWEACPKQLVLYLIVFIPSISACLNMWWSGWCPSTNNIPGTTNSTSSRW
jgi:hypothetical protein